jgi:IS605 OrfB family transposase
LLKRLSGRERRAVDWKLWNVANGIVREAAKAEAGVIVVEDLKGIRDRIKVAKKQRLIHHGWPFSSLFTKLTHVAGKRGIRVEFVDARNTSRTCSRCGHCEERNRKNQAEFSCQRCGYSHNADYNAAHNIRLRYAAAEAVAVTQRENPCLKAQG